MENNTEHKQCTAEELDILEVMRARHAVRKFADEPLSEEQISAIETMIARANHESGLHMHLMVNEKVSFASFLGTVCYGMFSNVRNYIALVSAPTHDELAKLGYYGEKIVLELTRMGLGTCWVGGSFSKKKTPADLNDDEQLNMIIMVGKIGREGRAHKSKSLDDLSIIPENMTKPEDHLTHDLPQWFMRGMEAVSLAPSSLNSQKTLIELVNDNPKQIRVLEGTEHFSMVNAAIARAHFELAVPDVEIV